MQLLSGSEIYKVEVVCQAKISGSIFEPVTPRYLPLQVETDVLDAHQSTFSLFPFHREDGGSSGLRNLAGDE
jgi:hypothetical protein